MVRWPGSPLRSVIAGLAGCEENLAFKVLPDVLDDHGWQWQAAQLHWSYSVRLMQHGVLREVYDHLSFPKCASHAVIFLCFCTRTGAVQPCWTQRCSDSR